MAEPVGPQAQGAQGANAGQLAEQLRASPIVDRLTVYVSLVVLIAALLPWNGAELLTGGRIGVSSGIFALLSLLAGIGAGVTVLGRLTGALDLGENAPMIATALGAGCLGFAAIHLVTTPTLASTGVYLTLACGGFLTYLGLARKRGDSLAIFERPNRAARVKGGPITSQMIISKVMRVVSIGPIIGSAVAGAAMFPASHSVMTTITTSVGMMAVMTLLRMGDGVLRPLWVIVGGVPPVLRLPAGIVVPLYISISRVQPEAGGLEVESMRTAMFLSVIVVYILFHGPPKDVQTAEAGTAGHVASGPPSLPSSAPPSGQPLPAPPPGPPPVGPPGG